MNAKQVGAGGYPINRRKVFGTRAAGTPKVLGSIKAMTFDIQGEVAKKQRLFTRA
jgi:hypothetical protein